MGGGKSIPTVDELISYLKHTQIPTVVIEGKDDYIAYRRMEDRFKDHRLSMLAAGGRDAVLAIYDRRAEIANGAKLGFIVDRDCWVYDEVPEQYISDELIFTDGYSIENDLYRDGDLERFLLEPEIPPFRSELSEFISWYSHALNEHLAGQGLGLKFHPDMVVVAGELQSEFCEKCGYSGPIEPLNSNIRAEYQKLLRGKSLLALLSRHLTRPGRPARLSTANLMEHSAVARGPYLTMIEEGVAQILAS